MLSRRHFTHVDTCYRAVKCDRSRDWIGQSVEHAIDIVQAIAVIAGSFFLALTDRQRARQLERIAQGFIATVSSFRTSPVFSTESLTCFKSKHHVINKPDVIWPVLELYADIY